MNPADFADSIKRENVAVKGMTVVKPRFAHWLALALFGGCGEGKKKPLQSKPEGPRVELSWDLTPRPVRRRASVFPAAAFLAVQRLLCSPLRALSAPRVKPRGSRDWRE